MSVNSTVNVQSKAYLLRIQTCYVFNMSTTMLTATILENDCIDNARKYRSGVDTESWILDYKQVTENDLCIEHIMYSTNAPRNTRSHRSSVNRTHSIIRDW